MSKDTTGVRFKAKLLRPARSAKGESWTFLVLPRSASEKLPRRGRTGVEGKINGHPFHATLEPDGQLSHWLKVDQSLLAASGAAAGDTVELEMAPVAKEPEPELPRDFRQALAASPQARAVWEATTTIARIDWIHWIESAKQARTRQSRIGKACDLLASGEKRVCCFDSSGFYSKSLSAPEAAEG
ncbi:YdeI/OmpD-associated family protein [Ottowia sp.]|uniref:YdeI/OmpD-associated family protein n=1 Tax=Ottowia sp. TaxID=1898956 RepID=UPI0039E56D0A